MELKISDPDLKGQILKLKNEIAELEKTRKQLFADTMRGCGLFFLATVLLTFSAALVWLLPRPIPPWIILMVLAMMGIGVYIIVAPSKRKRKSAEEIKRENALLREIAENIEEKKRELAGLEKRV
jgi:hypothetical protein